MIEPGRSLLLGVIALGCLAHIGCKREPAPADPAVGAAERHLVKGALDRALRDLDARLGAQATRGWPEDVALSAAEPRRPVLEIGVITNATSLPLDMKDLERRITQQLVDGGHVVVTAGAAREDPSVGGATGAEAGGNDVAGLLLVGTLEEVVLELEAGVRAHEAIVTLTVTDMRRRPLVEARGEFALVRGAR